MNGDGKMVDMIDQFVNQCGSSECYSNSGVQKWQESLAQTNKALQVTTCWRFTCRTKAQEYYYHFPQLLATACLVAYAIYHSHSSSSSEMLYGLCKSPAAAMWIPLVHHKL